MYHLLSELLASIWSWTLTLALSVLFAITLYYNIPYHQLLQRVYWWVLAARCYCPPFSSISHAKHKLQIGLPPMEMVVVWQWWVSCMILPRNLSVGHSVLPRYAQDMADASQVEGVESFLQSGICHIMWSVCCHTSVCCWHRHCTLSSLSSLSIWGWSTLVKWGEQVLWLPSQSSCRSWHPRRGCQRWSSLDMWTVQRHRVHTI